MRNLVEKLKGLTKEQKIVAAAVAAVIVVALVIGCVLLFFKGGEAQEEQNGPKTYSIEVKSEGGKPFEAIEIHVFEDSTLTDLAAVGRTDENGVYSFEADASDKYVAVLKNVPAGYPVEEFYSINSEMLSITLKASLLSEEDVTGALKLGNVAADMTITAADGKTYKISELLKEKKAVVLNFWYEGCQPCRMEFPYLEEAYRQYSDKLEILAVNTYDGDDASVKAYQSSMGLSFPMAKADTDWANIYSVNAYPTTVVIDRYGTIGFLHTGMIPDTETFVQLFEYFTSDSYVQSTIRNIEDIVEKVEGGEGTKANPFEKVELEFTAELPAGEEVYYQMYKVGGMLLEVTGTDVYVLHNEKKYEAVDGKVSLILSGDDVYVPVVFAIGNTSAGSKNCAVKVSFPEGSVSNPFKMPLGDFNLSVEAGNETGIYYTYTAEENGTLTLKCNKATEGVSYDFSLYNANAYIFRNLSSDGNNGEVSIAVNAGDEVRFCAATLPNENNEYVAADFTFTASFAKGEGTGVDPNKKTSYKVTVVDNSGKALSGVTVTFIINETSNTAKTNASGVAEIESEGTNCQVVVTAPTGYKEDTNEYVLTKLNNTLKITLEKKPAEKKTYTVTVVDESGKAISGASVTVGSSNYGKTDSNGKATFSLEEDNYSVSAVASGYTSDGKNYSFSNGATSLTVVLKKEVVQVKEIEYTVTVKDYSGKAISGVSVQFKSGNTIYATETTNTKGVATVKLKEGTYMVSVVDNTYGSGSATLTASGASANLIAAKRLDTSTGTEYYFGTAYPISEGAIYTELNTDTENYFLFTPKKAGVYEIKTTSTDAKLAPCGSSSFVYTPTYEGNVYETEIVSGMLGGNIAVSVTGASGAVIVVTRIGDANEIINREYEGTKDPTNFTLTSGGDKLTYVDVSASAFQIVLGSDGFYHKDSATGPVVYVNLGTNAPYLSLQAQIQGTGHAGGSALVSYYTENGKQIREDYTNFLTKHFDCMDQTYGIYPLTEDLKYVLQTAGEYVGWWDKTNANNAYLFSNVKNLNKDIAWMFACCYVK